MEPFTQLDYPSYCNSMGLTQVAAGMDSALQGDAEELRLELDDRMSADMTAETGTLTGAARAQASMAAAAEAHPSLPSIRGGQSGDHADSLPSEHAQEEPVAAALVPAAAELRAGRADPPVSPAAQAASAAWPAAMDPWRVPLGILRAMIGGRLQSLQDAADPAVSQAAVLPSSGRPTPSLDSKLRLCGSADADITVPAAVSATAAPADTSLASAQQPKGADPSMLAGDDVVSILRAAQTSDLLNNRPVKRRRTAREVVCEFFGLQDSDFAQHPVI